MGRCTLWHSRSDSSWAQPLRLASPVRVLISFCISLTLCPKTFSQWDVGWVDGQLRRFLVLGSLPRVLNSPSSIPCMLFIIIFQFNTAPSSMAHLISLFLQDSFQCLLVQTSFDELCPLSILCFIGLAVLSFLHSHRFLVRVCLLCPAKGPHPTSQPSACTSRDRKGWRY